MIAILNHPRIAVKIPTRSFLMDFGLVGASVFVLACLAQPKNENWVATVHRDDGTHHSIRVDYQGDDETHLRQSILSELVPPEGEKLGLARWQSETSLFYAQAVAQRMASSNDNGKQDENGVFRTASYQAEGASESPSGDSTTDWVGFWNRRGNQSANWLNEYNEFHQRRVARISESLVVGRVNAFLPARKGVLLAIAAAIFTIGIGTLWCVWIPRRTLSGHTALRGLIVASRSAEGGAAAVRSEDLVEPAAMSFRSSWVRLRQPFAVQTRRACGWMIVLSAMIAIVGRLL